MNKARHSFTFRSDAELCSVCGETMEEGMHQKIPSTAVIPTQERNHSAVSNIAHALSTYTQRNRTYGNSYHKFGIVMAAMFPNGICLKSVEDFNRYGIIFMQMSKMIRYTADPHKGHIDSVHDTGVYSFMLEELDALAQGLPATYVRPRIDPNWCEHVWEGDICLVCDSTKNQHKEGWQQP